MFPERLKTIRKERGLTQADLAKLIGIKKDAISRWESGSREPNFTRLMELCDALDATSDYLLGRTPDSDLGVISDTLIPEGQDNNDKDV